MSRFLWCYFTILLAFGQVLLAQLPRVEPSIPEDGLQIRLERELYASQQSVVYASHLEFDQQPKISDRQFLKIAIDAFKEMRHMVDENKLGKKKIPNVMTTLLVGNEMIFASSAKGSNDPIRPDGQVQDDLAECGPGKHKNNGRCGEVMAFHEYYESHVDPQKLGADSGARIVAIAFPRDADLATAQPEILAPCGSGDNWGCNRLVKDLNVLDNDKVAADPEMADFDYKTLRNEGKLKSIKTKFEEGNGSLPGDRPGGQKKKGPPPNNLPPPHKHKPSTPADADDDGGSEDKQVDDSGRKQGPPPNNLPPRPPTTQRPSTPVESGDDGDDDDAGREADGGRRKGPPPNNLPPRPPTTQRPSTPVDLGDDGDDAGREVHVGKKPGPPPNNLRPRPPTTQRPSSPVESGDDGDDDDDDDDDDGGREANSGRRKRPPPNNLRPRPPTTQRPSSPVESGDDNDDGDVEADRGKKKKTPPHRRPPPPRPHHNRSRAPAPDQDGEESGHEEPRDADKVESSATKRLLGETHARHESRRYFRA